MLHDWENKEEYGENEYSLLVNILKSYLNDENKKTPLFGVRTFN